jgi:signal transduction histidine kinase/ActR/RegA family two-component response regulator
MNHHFGQFQDMPDEPGRDEEAQQAALRRLADLSREAMLIVEHEGQIRFANAAARRLLELRPEAVSQVSGAADPHEEGSLPLLRIARESDGVPYTAAQLWAESGGPEGGFVRGFCVMTQHGDTTPVELSVDHGVGSLYLLVMQRLEVQRRIEEELAKQERLLSVRRRLWALGHEMNNALTVVLGCLNVLGIESTLPARALTLIRQAERSVEDMRMLAGQMLAHSPGELLKHDPGLTSTEELVRYCAESALRGFPVRCHVSGSSSGYRPTLPVAKLEQVVSALVLNAAEAMPSGGVVTVHVGLSSSGETGTVETEDAPEILITVRDTGSSTAVLDTQRMFQPYFTTKEDAAGLGLTVARDLVRDYGGHIWVEYEPGEGATFTVTLPVERRPKAESPRILDRDEAARFRVLFMDDEENMRSVAREMLVALGFRVTVAVDGQETVLLYRQALTGGKPFDIVILDLTVPGATGGLDTIQQLRDLDPRVTGVLSSGHTNHPAMERFAALGFRAAIAKPFTMEELGATLAGVLREGQR